MPKPTRYEPEQILVRKTDNTVRIRILSHGTPINGMIYYAVEKFSTKGKWPTHNKIMDLFLIEDVYELYKPFKPGYYRRKGKDVLGRPWHVWWVETEAEMVNPEAFERVEVKPA